MARVLIVDDNESIRQLVRFTLETDPSLEIVGEAANGAEGVHQAERLAPDLIVMDLAMPVMNGIESTRWIKAARPEVEVVAFTSATEQSLIGAALAAGAHATVDKADIGGLLRVLQELSEPRVATEAGAAPAVVATLPAPYWEGLRGAAAGIVDPSETMTPRVRQALAVGAWALGAAAIAALLLFVFALQLQGRDDPATPRAGIAVGSDRDDPRVGSVVAEADGSQSAKGKRAGRKGRATRSAGDNNASGSSDGDRIAQAPAPASGGSSTSPSGGSKPSGSSKTGGDSKPSGEPEVAAMPAKHEVPVVAAANFKARWGAGKGSSGTAKEKRT